MKNETEHQRRMRVVNSMKDDRAKFLPEWRTLSQFIAPHAGVFIPTQKPGDERRNYGNILRGTASLALNSLVSGFMSGVTNPASKWIKYRMLDPELSKQKPVKQWLEYAQTATLEMFLKSNIYTVLPKVYRDLGLFATGVMSIEEDVEDEFHESRGIICRHFPVGSYVLGTDYRGRVNMCAREYKMTARQMVQEFGKENCSHQVISASEKSEQSWFDVVWLVEPNPDHDAGKLHSKYKRFRSTKFEPSESEKTLSVKGYNEFPVIAARWDVEGECAYGTDCPGMAALGSVKSLQKREIKSLNALDKLVDPPMVGPPGMDKPSAVPSTVTILPQGQGSFGPSYQINPHFQEMEMSKQRVEQEIKRHFHEDLFLMFANHEGEMTAFEASKREQEKLAALGPTYLRLNDEGLDPIAERCLAIMFRNGMLPPPPPEMQGQAIGFEYISTMSQAMKMVGVGSIERLYQFAGAVIAVSPTSAQKLNGDAAIDIYADNIGTHPSLVRDDKEVAAMRQALAEKEAQQQAAMTMEQAAKTGQVLSQTNVTEPSALTQLMSAAQQGALG